MNDPERMQKVQNEKRRTFFVRRRRVEW